MPVGSSDSSQLCVWIEYMSTHVMHCVALASFLFSFLLSVLLYCYLFPAVWQKSRNGSPSGSSCSMTLHHGRRITTRLPWGWSLVISLQSSLSSCSKGDRINTIIMWILLSNTQYSVLRKGEQPNNPDTVAWQRNIRCPDTTLITTDGNNPRRVEFVFRFYFGCLILIWFLQPRPISLSSFVGYLRS